MGSSGDSTTLLGGPPQGFPDTSWGMIDPAVRHHPSFLERLALRYWKPVYLYIRIAWAKSNEDAKDLAQAFFLWLMEEGALAKYARERGSFRAFLKVLLRRFVGHRERALARLKRGGGVRLLPLDEVDSLEIAAAGDPEERFDREWLNAILRGALERVREHYLVRGREGHLRLFEEHDLAAPAVRPSYEELAARHGLKAGDVRNRLFAVREALRAEVRRELAELTSGAGELEEEWHALFES